MSTGPVDVYPVYRRTDHLYNFVVDFVLHRRQHTQNLWASAFIMVRCRETFFRSGTPLTKAAARDHHADTRAFDRFQNAACYALAKGIIS